MITPGFQSAFRPVADCISDLGQNTVDLQDVQYLEIMTHLYFTLLLLAQSNNRDMQNSIKLTLAAGQWLAGQLKQPLPFPSQKLRGLHRMILCSTGDVLRQWLFLPSLSVQLNDSCLKSIWVFHLCLICKTEYAFSDPINIPVLQNEQQACIFQLFQLIVLPYCLFLW